MHWLDVTILIVLGLGLALGFWSGLLWQVARFVTFGVAVFACIFGHGYVNEFLKIFLTGWEDWLVHLFAYVVTFFGVFLILYGLTWLVEQWVKKAKLKMLDRGLGAGLGLVKTTLLAGTVLLGVAVFAKEQSKDWFTESRLAVPLLTVMQGAIVAIPQEYKDGWNDSVEEVKKTVVAKAEEAGREAGKAAVDKVIPDELKPTPTDKSPHPK